MMRAMPDTADPRRLIPMLALMASSDAVVGLVLAGIGLAQDTTWLVLAGVVLIVMAVAVGSWTIVLRNRPTGS